MQDLQQVCVYTSTLAPVQELFSKMGGGGGWVGVYPYFTVLVVPEFNDFTWGGKVILFLSFLLDN